MKIRVIKDAVNQGIMVIGTGREASVFLPKFDMTEAEVKEFLQIITRDLCDWIDGKPKANPIK